MDEFGCDYQCRTVGEGIIKHHIPDDWCVEFVVWNEAYPDVCMEVEALRKNPALMELKIRIVENEDMEYAGCMVCTEEKTIFFKVDYMRELVKAISKG